MSAVATNPERTTRALTLLRDALASSTLELETAGAEEGRRVRDELVAQVDDYLLPRLREMSAPLLMVVGGSTGAGKSTLVNSLVGSPVSPAGVLRPTTRWPVLVFNPADLAWFEGDRILPALARTTGGPAGPGGLELVPSERLPAGLGLLDSPDLDSVVAENRALARQLLAAADSWLFVTTAERYADAVPWELLHAARDRGTALAIVLNRVPDDGRDEVTGHLREMLARNGLEGAPVLVVSETELEADGRLPAAALAPVRRWLDELAADADARAALVRRTLAGALASIPDRVEVVERSLAEQVATAEELARDVESAYETARDEIEQAVTGGTLLRGEVLARWYDVVGTGNLMRSLQTEIGRLRDRIRTAIAGRPRAVAEVEAEVETSVEAVVRAAADRAAERAVSAWRSHPAGRALLAGAPPLDAASAGLPAAAEDEVRAWQGDVFELVRREGAGKRTGARLASLGVNGAGLTVMLAVFVHTGGLTGAEVAVAGGTSAVGQKVLEAIFGDQAVRALAAQARDNLLTRVDGLLASESRRFATLLEPHAPQQGSVDRLREAVGALGASS